MDHSPTDFGVWVVHDYWVESATLSGNLQRAADDEFKIVRYLDEVSTAEFTEFLSEAKDKGFKVVVHSPVAASCTASASSAVEYADHIKELLTLGYSYIQDGTVFGIEIGGEEEGKQFWWEDGFTPELEWWFGNQVQGASFAQYYLEARDVIKNTQNYPDWNKLEIWSGGTPWQHESLAYAEDSEYGNAGNFIKGYIAAVIEAATLDQVEPHNYLPDAISIHGYSMAYSPEYFVNTTGGDYDAYVTEWFDRLGELYDICSINGYVPKFAMTEYGFSPYEHARNPFAPSGASEISHAVYYLRSCLINATVREATGVGWKNINYISHPGGIIDDGQWIQDYGFHNPPDAGEGYPFGSDRAIKFVARNLFDDNVTSPTPELKLQDSDTTVWLPVQRGEYNQQDDEGHAWCGWETQDGANRQKWGAIWRYRRDNDNYYESPSNESRDFEVPGNSPLTVSNLYRMDIDDGTAPIIIVSGTVSKTYSGGITKFSIPNVNENPVIIKFN